MKPHEQDSLIDLKISEQGWAEQLNNIPNMLENCLEAIWQTLDYQPQAEICVLLTNDKQMQELNNKYRGKNIPTNVLSFASAPFAGAPLGDLALGYETCIKEITARGISLDEHLCHLFVHGVLHLIGFDHQEHLAATKMEQLESLIMLKIGSYDPWQNDKGK